MAVAVTADEEARLLRFLERPRAEAGLQFQDDLRRRVAHLAGSDEGSDLDLAVLIRQLLRRRSLEDRNTALVTTAPSISARLRGAPRAGLREVASDVWSAPAWRPDWLDPLGTPDGAAAAGEVSGRRFEFEELAADPFFAECTGFDTYRTPGQRAACRAVVSVPDGSTVIAMLPTGSGKTEVALCLAERHRFGVTVVVVPTTALAYDLERRFRDHLAARNRRVDRAALHLAWTSRTSEGVRELIRQRVRAGKQRFLVTSPESVGRALRHLLIDAAGAGRLGALVVDEAHLVTHWGRDFRPEFRTLADLRTTLVDAATEVGYPPPVTLLLSATLGPDELADLHHLFTGPGRCTLIAANALRVEQDLFVAAAEDDEHRAARVLEALAYLPRPAILYVTRPADAEGWADRLRAAGWDRLAVVTGETKDADRAAVLNGLRATAGRPAVIDLVVATSAFGMGIDYPHVRSIVHACLPETVDRWYQELGRGGRDGDAAVALLLTAPQDRPEAARLGITVLTAEVARRRWRDLWDHRESAGDRDFVDLEGSRGAVGSYNLRWHNQLVQGLVELGALRRLPTDAEDVAELTDPDGRVKHQWVGVALLRSDWDTDEFWRDVWSPWQKREMGRSQQALTAIQELAGDAVAACAAIARAYRPDERTYDLFGDAARFVEPLAPCGRCPGCRRAGITPGKDPAPRPPQSWPLPADAAPDLDDLVAAGATRQGLVVLVADDPREVAPRLARVLLRRGIRHLAGLIDGPANGPDWLFVDPAPVTPQDLTPRSVFVGYPAGTPVPGRWLNTAQRMANRGHAAPPVDVLLLARGATLGDLDPVRDLRALDVLTVLQVLGE